MNRQDNPWALVTGAGRKWRGGEAIARELARDYNIYLHYRSDLEEARSIVDSIYSSYSEDGMRIKHVQADLSDPSSVGEMFKELYPLPTYYVHNASLFAEANATGDSLSEQLAELAKALDSHYNSNIKSTVLLSHAAASSLIEAGKRGSVVLLGDAWIGRGRTYGKKLLHYTATRSPIPAMIRELSVAYGPQGIYFSGIGVGPMKEPNKYQATENVESIRKSIHVPSDEKMPWLGFDSLAIHVHNMLVSPTSNGIYYNMDGARE